MGHRNLHNPKVRSYMQEQVLTETLVNEGVESLRQALKANRMITNRRGEVVDTWARLRQQTQGRNPPP